jgi:hypothetical protein
VPEPARRRSPKDPYVTLRYYSHWLPTGSADRLVTVLDDTRIKSLLLCQLSYRPEGKR